jgi:hypothetical protein
MAKKVETKKPNVWNSFWNGVDKIANPVNNILKSVEDGLQKQIKEK